MTQRIIDRLMGTGAAAILGLALLAAPGAAVAQQPAQPAPAAPEAAPPSTPPAAAPQPSRRMSRVEAHLRYLRSELKITPAQTAQWDNVANVMREQAREIDRLVRERNAKRATMSAVDDLKSYQAIADAHAEEMRKLVPAFEALYDTMSPAQKKNADKVFGPHPRRRR